MKEQEEFNLHKPGKRQREHETQQRSTKQRKAVPPGYLHGLWQARQRINHVGLSKATNSTVSTSTQTTMPGVAQNTSNRAPMIPRGANPVPFVPANTLPIVFQQRKKFLQHKKQRLRTPYQRRPGQPVGLLSIPEDVLLKIVCYLTHDEIKPLFHICKPLAHTLHEAIRFHFNYATPARPGEGPQPQTGGAPAPENNNNNVLEKPKRHHGVTNLAAVLAQLKRPRAVAPGETSNAAAPRMLKFGSAQNTPRSQ